MRFIQLLALLLFTLLSVSFVFASAGINPPPIEQRRLVFEPGLTKTWSFNVFGAPVLETYLSGDLQQYAVLEDPAQNSSARSISLTLHLPDQLEPGRYVLRVFAREASPGGMMGGRAAIGAGIAVLSLYPTPYLKAELSAESVGVGEQSSATLTLTSWSESVTPDAWADLVVIDQDGQELVHATSDHSSIPAQETKTLTIPLATQELEPGQYSIIAHIHGAQENLTAKSTFRIGVLNLVLKEYPKKMTAGRINRFKFIIENKWNEKLDDVFGLVRMGSISEQTPTGSLPGFGTSSFSAYLDTTSLGVNATLDGNITMQYTTPAGEKGTQVLPFTTTIVPEDLPVADIPPEELRKGFFIPLNMMTLLYLALFILVLINLYLLFGRKRRGDER